MLKYIACAAAACAAFATSGTASAAGHKDLGFYIGVGTHVSYAELSFDKPYASGTTVFLSNVTGDIGPMALTGIDAAISTRIPVTVTARAEDNAPEGYGAYIGYRLSENIAVELGYAELGEFTATYATNITGAFAVAVPGGTVPLVLAASTISFRAIEDVNVISGAVLANYQVSDNFDVFGRIGYYATETTEALTFDWTGSLTPPDEIDISGGARLSTPVVEEAAGLLYGLGVEYAFGRNRNFLLRGELTLLQDGLGELEDIGVLAINGSYKF